MERFLLLAVAAVLAGCGASRPSAANVPPKPPADQERLIRENTQLTPEQKERELARLRATP